MEAMTALQHLNFTPQRDFKTSHHSLSNTCSSSKFNTISLLKGSHAQIIKTPKNSNSIAKEQSLITSYLELGDFQSAAMVFFLGSAKSYSFLEDFGSFGGDPFEILEVFVELHNMGVAFGSENMATVLKLCANLMDSWLGLQVHVCLIKRGFDLDVYAKCALMNFYGRCWGLDIVNRVFDDMSDCNSLSWNEAVLVHLRNERWFQGLETFRKMLFLPINNNNNFTIAKILQACGKMEALHEGRQIHGYTIRHAMESNLSICNSLINMYLRNGNLELTRNVFDLTENRNVSTWNSIISGYTGSGHLEDSQALLREMRTSNVWPDIVTWNSLLSGHLQSRSYQEVMTVFNNLIGTP